MMRGPRILLAVLFAVIVIPILAITVFFSMDLLGAFFTAVEVTPIGGKGKDAISSGVGNGWFLFATGGLLSIPAAVLLLLLTGNRVPRRSRRKPPRSGGPPF